MVHAVNRRGAELTAESGEAAYLKVNFNNLLTNQHCGFTVADKSKSEITSESAVIMDDFGCEGAGRLPSTAASIGFPQTHVDNFAHAECEARGEHERKTDTYTRGSE
jgi:hypothetical protein